MNRKLALWQGLRCIVMIGQKSRSLSPKMSFTISIQRHAQRSAYHLPSKSNTGSLNHLFQSLKYRGYPCRMRHTDASRKEAIEAKLLQLGLSPNMFSEEPQTAGEKRDNTPLNQLELLNPNVYEYFCGIHNTGTPAIRAYNSFISPRTPVQHSDVDVARIANQIAFLYREHRAEVTNFVRNKDKNAKVRADAGINLNPIKLVRINETLYKISLFSCHFIIEKKKYS
jgi:hypothetical protein